MVAANRRSTTCSCLEHRSTPPRYAKEHDLIIVSKDADFSDWVMLSEPPPKVIHLRTGNMRLRDLFVFLQRVWPQLCELSATHKLVIVHETQIEYIA